MDSENTKADATVKEVKSCARMKPTWREKQTNILEVFWRGMNARVLQGKQAVTWSGAGQYQDLLFPPMPGAEPAAESPLHSQMASTFPSAAPAQIKLPSLPKCPSRAGAWQGPTGE